MPLHSGASPPAAAAAAAEGETRMRLSLKTELDGDRRRIPNATL